MREQEESDKLQVALYSLLKVVNVETECSSYGSHNNQLSTILSQTCLTMDGFPKCSPTSQQIVFWLRYHSRSNTINRMRAARAASLQRW